MNTRKEIEQLKNEVVNLAERFADSQNLISVNAVIDTGRTLKSWHLDQGCKQCLQPNKFMADDLDPGTQTTLPTNSQECFNFDEPRKSEVCGENRKSIRTSRKSVCVLPKFISSSESSASEADDECDDYGSPIIARKKGNTASQQILSSEEEEEIQFNNIGKNQNFHSLTDISYGKEEDQLDYDSDATDVDGSLHDDYSHNFGDDASPVRRCKENAASQRILSSDEEEGEERGKQLNDEVQTTREILGKNCTSENASSDAERNQLNQCNQTFNISSTVGNVELVNDETDSDETDINGSIPNASKFNISQDHDSPVEQRKGFVASQNEASSDKERVQINMARSDRNSIFKADYVYPVKKATVAIETHENNIHKQLLDCKTTLVLESEEEESMDVNTEKPDHVILESSCDEDESFKDDESVKKKISYGSSSDNSDTDVKPKENTATAQAQHFDEKPESAAIAISSEDEEDLNAYISSLKISESDSQKSDDSDGSMKDFIVDDDEDLNTVSNNLMFHPKTPKLNSVKPKTFLSESKFNTFATPRSSTRNALGKLKIPKSVPGTPAYKREFNKIRENTLKELLALFNATVFEGKLPKDLQVTWNKRMTKTAGFCYYSMGEGTRTSRIELSDKVIDSVERVRDTLIHELCHAATWIIDGKKAGHGPAWKYWAKRANKVHPDLPVIARCHQYEIQTKYNYQCNGCGQMFGRHSKSIDASRHRCSRCGGIPELVHEMASSSATPKTPNAYALFVKENFASTKKSNPGLPHKEIMQKISAKYRESKIDKENKENVN